VRGRPDSAMPEPMEHPRIERDPAIMVGKPVIRGTRVTGELVRRDVAAGRSFAAIADAYPRLSLEDIQAALTYAADYMAHESLR
jgi:uncharacterized protein (DUF433 family)